MRLIDPKMSIDTIKSYIEVWDCKGCLPYGETQHNVMAVDDLQYLPTIEAEPVRHGRWKWENGYVGTMAVCSICGSSPRGFYSLPKNQIGRLPVYKYCPRCGARMDGKE